MATSSLQATSQADVLRVVAAGSWTATHAGVLEPLVEAVVVKPEFVTLSVDLHAVSELDTFGACLIERLMRRWKAATGKSAQIAGLSEHLSGLVAEVERVAPVGVALAPKSRGWLAALADLGDASAKFVVYMATFAAMLGTSAYALIIAILHPRRFRLTSVVNQLDRVGLQAVPIILLITFLIGAIIAQQGIFHFRKFGAGDYVVDLVGILVLREIGVLIVAIMVAGRSGSSYTAELGSMKMREEIDALRTMGLDEAEVLVLPRVLALVIALPILTFLGSLSALYGGGLVAWFYGGMAPAIYIERLKDAISVSHFEVGMIKAPFMALVIGIVACIEGFKVEGSAESLGIHTTSSVVKSIFLVIVLDGLFAIFFASVGM
jgi:phospholipid/cholesterol/gamma-HCH transport system permease protein